MERFYGITRYGATSMVLTPNYREEQNGLCCNEHFSSITGVRSMY
jgi:hypothetical protein